VEVLEMGEAQEDRRRKVEVMKDIVLKLHQGLSVEEAKERFEREVGNISSLEIAELEQSLINEGLSPEEIRKFCNVHALLFQSTLEKSVSIDTSPAHPIHLFKLENREIEKIIESLKQLIQHVDQYEPAWLMEKLKELLTRLKEVDIHYTRKEQLLFPFLEKYGFYGPSKVMWGKDDEIRELMKNGLEGLGRLENRVGLEKYVKNILTPLIEEVEGMIFKEEKILFPTALEKLNIEDWVEILKESDDIGYAFIEKPKETTLLVEELKRAVTEEPTVKGDLIQFPTGELRLEELKSIFHILPMDITFVDKDDTVRFFSDKPDRIFVRTKAVLGRKVQNCHPPKSVNIVEKILQSFKEGTRDSADFWINFKGRFVLIRYFAVRDRDGNYLGTMEVTQDITEIKKLEGEKRLLDERFESSGASNINPVE
jgi:PAS domain S-box-containing protein